MKTVLEIVKTSLSFLKGLFSSKVKLPKAIKITDSVWDRKDSKVTNK